MNPAAVLIPFALLSFVSRAQITLPAGTQLPVTIPEHLPMKVGQPLAAETMYPIFSDNKLVLPAHTRVNGTVVTLTPNRPLRNRSRLNLDFTPFFIPVVQFNSIVLPSGTTLPITTGSTTDGAPLYRLVAPPPAHGGFIAQNFAKLKILAKEQIEIVTGPDKADRLTQLFYHQLPYHPQRIAKDTSWTAEIASPLTLPDEAPPAPLAARPQDAPDSDPPARIVEGYLTTPISSETSKSGEKISATISQPVLNPDGSVAIPQGSLLTGEVTQARRARKFSRPGELRFSFRQIQLPGEDPQSVRASLRGADSASSGQLAMDSEGQVKPKPQDKLVIPFILLSLAARPLDRDHGDSHMLGKDAVASNSLGFIGFIIGTAARQPNIAAGFGYYGGAISIYERIFAKGKPVAFPKDTRVIVQTTPTRSAALKPTSAP